MKIYKKLFTLIFMFLSLSLITTELFAQNDNLTSFEYRAWGMGGDDTHSKAILNTEDKTYKIVAYSEKNVLQIDASTAGDVTTLITNININGKIYQKQLTVSQDYLNSEIVLKIFLNSNLVGESFPIYLQNEGTYIKLETINVE